MSRYTLHSSLFATRYSLLAHRMETVHLTPTISSVCLAAPPRPNEPVRVPGRQPRPGDDQRKIESGDERRRADPVRDLEPDPGVGEEGPLLALGGNVSVAERRVAEDSD